ncbi:olfactomedin-4-like [Polypterus senegalus]|uniref:olfactomedin-4-like n=1 Tax=Polypterus senegalus TaxID=55291 RepID=UPI0019656F46|nr:olfactomedin-4-like [Polypterus senegalus]
MGIKFFKMPLCRVLLLLGAIVSTEQVAVTSVSNTSGTLDANGVCRCAVYLPDEPFPVDRFEKLEILSVSLSSSVQQEISKIQQYTSKMYAYEQRLQNLTARVQTIERGDISFTELDFELLRIEIAQMESLVTQLKTSVSDSNGIISQLYTEIRNMSTTIASLETMDKNNVVSLRREILSLKKRLQDCDTLKNQTIFSANSRPIVYEKCNHGTISNVSQPFVVQLNWRGFSYKAGAWGRDPEPVSPKKELYWQAPLNTDMVYMQWYRYYLSYDDFLLYRSPAEKSIAYGQGSGMVVFKNHLYYNCYNTRDVCKLELDTNTITVRKTITNAAFNNRFSYSTPWQDIDVVVDESGLWVIYATEESTGNIVISKLNETTLNIDRTWVTKQYKPSVSNAFIVCGVLYATRTVNTRQEEIFYMYDTKTEQESRISVTYNKVMEYIYGVNYNPKDHKLYVYNDGYLLTYDLNFYNTV